jgi:hypothetical protein
MSGHYFYHKNITPPQKSISHPGPPAEFLMSINLNNGGGAEYNFVLIRHAPAASVILERGAGLPWN